MKRDGRRQRVGWDYRARNGRAEYAARLIFAFGLLVAVVTILILLLVYPDSATGVK